MGESSVELEDLRRMAALARSLIDSADFVSMDRDELLPALKEVEVIKRLIAVLDARLVYVVDEIGLNLVHGATSTQALVRQELQVSPSEALARTRAARDLAPRMDEDGAPLEPVLPQTAEALAEAAIGSEHAAVIQRFMHRLIAPRGASLYPRFSREELEGSVPGSDDLPGPERGKGTVACQETNGRVQA